MNKKRYIRKRSFLLFELLASIFLIMLCLAPLLKPHIGIQKEKRRHLKEMQLEIAAQNLFCRLKQSLHEHQIPFDELSSWDGEFEGAHIKIVKLDRSKKKVTQDTALVLGVDFYLESQDKPFTRRTLYVQRLDKWPDEQPL